MAYNAAAVSDAVIAHQKPITLQQGRGLRDNPLAIAEGLNNAPYVRAVWHPFDGTNIGDGANGEIWSFAADGAVASIDSPDFDEGYEYRFRLDRLNTSGPIRINLYRNASAAYAGTINLIRLDGTTTINSVATGWVDVHRAGLVAGQHAISMAVYEAPVADSLIAATGNAERVAVVTHAAAQRLLRAQFTSGGNFTAGAIYMDRRRVYA